MLPARVKYATLIAFLFGMLVSVPVRAQENRVVYEIRSPYQLITVQDTAGGYRQLIFDGKFDGTDAIQSEMNLADHEELTLSYSRHIMTALPLVSTIRRILIVGLGGACMQRYLHKLLPGATIETAELDPEIRTIAASYFFYKEDARQIVRLGDGRNFIENSKDKYDIIFLDAFSAESIPYRLTTQEFLSAVRNHLAEGGVVCANLWDADAGYMDMVKTYSSVFPEWHVVKCALSGNSILVAMPKKAEITVQGWMRSAEEFEKLHATGLNLPQLVSRGATEKTDIPPSAKILIDKMPSYAADASVLRIAPLIKSRQ
jgi:spermidine synthase